jgi:L-Ala-D/L-Glu epimerase
LNAAVWWNKIGWPSEEEPIWLVVSQGGEVKSGKERSTMKGRVIQQNLVPRNVFRISRAARKEVQNVFLELSDGGITGWGEASPNAFYGETARRVAAALEAVLPWLGDLHVTSPADIGRIWREAWARLSPSRAAQCALDLALWDWLARSQGVPVAQLALGRPARPVCTFCTIGLSEEAELERKIAELRGFPRVKVKSDARADLAPVRRIKAETGAEIAVDANASWGAVDGAAVLREAAEIDTLFVEQPLAPAEDAQLPLWRGKSEVPVLADESCVTREDVERMPSRFSGFNIKLVKCGGLTPALEMARRGRELGLKTMVGCMLESSLLIAAGAVVAQETDYADLDGAWLLGNDPFAGLPLNRGVLTPGPGPGFGVDPSMKA